MDFKAAIITIVPEGETKIALNLLHSLKALGLSIAHMSYVASETDRAFLVGKGFNATLLADPADGSARPGNERLKYGVASTLMGRFSHIWMIDYRSVVTGNILLFLQKEAPKDVDLICGEHRGKIAVGNLVLKSGETTFALCQHMATKVASEAQEADLLSDIVPRVEPTLSMRFLEPTMFPSSDTFFGPSQSHDEYVAAGHRPLLVQTVDMGSRERMEAAMRAKGLWAIPEDQSIAKST